MDRPKRKRSYYIPGFISLLILPIAFHFSVQRQIRQSTTWAMRISWLDTARLKSFRKPDENLVVHVLPERNFTEIEFTGEQNADKIKLAFSKLRIKEILDRKDTLNALHFLFGNNSTYGMVVGAFDNLQALDVEKYVLGDKDIWFWNVPPDPAMPIENSYLLCDNILHVEPEISWWTNAKENAGLIWIHAHQLILLYIGFITSIIILQRRNTSASL